MRIMKTDSIIVPVLALFSLLSCGEEAKLDIEEDTQGLEALPGVYYITKSEVRVGGQDFSELKPKDATLTIKEEGDALTLELSYSFDYLKAYSEESEDKDILLTLPKVPCQKSGGNYCFTSMVPLSDVVFLQANETASLSDVTICGTFGKDVDLTISGTYRGFQAIGFHIASCSKSKIEYTPNPYFVTIDWFPCALVHLHNGLTESISARLIWKEGIPLIPISYPGLIPPGQERILSDFSMVEEGYPWMFLKGMEIVFADGHSKLYSLVSALDYEFEGLGKPEVQPDYILHAYPHCVDRHAVSGYHYRMLVE